MNATVICNNAMIICNNVTVICNVFTIICKNVTIIVNIVTGIYNDNATTNSQVKNKVLLLHRYNVTVCRWFLIIILWSGVNVISHA